VIDGVSKNPTSLAAPTGQVWVAPRAIAVNSENNMVYVSNELSNNVTVIDDTPYTLAVSFTNDSGNGSINSNPSGISCVKGATAGCSSSSLSGIHVTLTAVANANTSIFAGWSGACSLVPCEFDMNTSKTATAKFTLAHKCKLALAATTGFGSLQAAYNDPAVSTLYAIIGDYDGDDYGVFTENWLLDKGKDIVLRGGYLADYINRNGFTILKGALTIKAGASGQIGSLRANGLVVRK
jgi:hypothetical protein